MKVKQIIGNRSEWIPNTQYEEVKPLVTVIFPTSSQSGSGLLKRCINSVLNQSFRRLELIIVIDGRSEATRKVCDAYAKKDSRVNLIVHEEQIGIPAISIYEAYRMSRGDYFAFIFDDNQWDLDALAKTYDFMEENEVMASCGIARVSDSTGSLIQFGKDVTDVESALWASNCIGAGSVVLRREVIETVGLQDPHLTMTKLGDWDYWLRISDRFKIAATAIPFCFSSKSEKKKTVKNSADADQWLFWERRQHRNLQTLLPDQFSDVDVLELQDSCSTHFVQCLSESFQSHENLSWFSSNELQQIRSFQGDPQHRYVLVACADKTASIMNFTRYKGDILTFCYVHVGNIPHNLLVRSDAVVIVRILEVPTVVSLCRTLNIPCYYFTDDNFREIMVDNDDLGIKRTASLTTAKVLKQFEAVLVTTPALKEYFLAQKLHDKVLVLNAVAEETLPQKTSENAVTIGFMGGPFRDNVLKSCILPALYKLSKKQPLRLILPCSKETRKKVLELEKNELEIVPFLRTSNYDYLLNAYNEIGVDIMVHCGGNLRNNIYKTKNALMNAVTLGAPLVVSDVEPYCDISDGSEDAYLLVANRPEAWLEGLKQLIGSWELRNRYLAKGTAYCLEHYNWKTVWADFQAELASVSHPGDFSLLRRYDVLCDWMVSHGIVGNGLTLAEASGYRIYVPEKLSYTQEIKSPRRFGFTSKVATIREVGLLFAVTGTCSGTVELRFFKRRKKDPAAIASLDISALRKDGYTNILLSDAITAAPGELLYMDIEIHYDKKDGYVGLFEERAHRTFIYKVFNKLGHPIPGRDALFIDCRG